MRARALGGALLAGIIGLTIVGCEGVVDPLADDDGPSGEGSPTQEATLTTIGFSGGGGVAAGVSATGPRFSAVALDQIASIEVTVERVEVHREGDGDGPGGWRSVTVDPPVTVDLFGLPDDGMVEVASEDLPAGRYDGLRFFFSDATITFDSEQAVPGPGEDIPAGEPVPLTIPSGAQTGVKVPNAGFDVSDDAGATVEVVFEEDVSVQNVTVTGTGEVIMAPVLAQKGNDDADEEDDPEAEEEAGTEEDEGGDDEGEPPAADATGSAAVALSRLGSSDAALASVLIAHDGRFSSVDLEEVESITVNVDLVEVHRRGDEEEDGEESDPEDGEGEEEPAPSTSVGTGAAKAWIGLTVEIEELDLLSLSVDEGLTITAEEVLPAGDYNGVRLFVSDATITFSEGQEVPGPGEDIPAGEAVPLEIPSGAQTGVKVPGAAFTVEEGGTTTVLVEFDEETSVRNVTVTGDGTVKMNPVLTPGEEEEGEEPAATT